MSNSTSSVTQLTSRQRMTRMLQRQDHDRIPRHDGFWPETIARWNKEGFSGDGDVALKVLGSDVAQIGFVWPCPFPGQEQVIEEDETTKVIKDSMGQIKRLWKDKWGTPEHIGFECDSAVKWREIYKPALLLAEPSIAAGQRERLERWKQQDQDERFCTICGIESFEAMRQLIGDEVLLMAMADDPDWVIDMSATYTDLIIGEWQILLNKWNGDDWHITVAVLDGWNDFSDYCCVCQCQSVSVHFAQNKDMK